MLEMLSMCGRNILSCSFRHMKTNVFRERLAKEKDNLVDLGSDQTSCHNPYHGGYYPVQVNK